MENLPWQDIITGLTSAVAVAAIVVKFTPNELDNKIVNTLMDILNVIALNNKKRGEK